MSEFDTYDPKDDWESFDADSQLKKFLDPDETKKARAAGDAHLNALAKNHTFTLEHYNQLRFQAKHKLFTLCRLLGYNKVTEGLHGHFASWIERNRHWRFKLELLPRGHYKSTIDTIAESVQGALPDPEGLSPWPNCLGPNSRTAIVHERAEQATKFLVSIAGHFLTNPMLVALFPECVPVRSKQRINQTELELPRTAIWNEATFTAFGITTLIQGLHVNKLKLDDIIGKAARESPTVMQSAKDWIDNVQSLFVEFDKDVLTVIGTRWSLDDVYAHYIKRYEEVGELLQYVRRVEEPDANGKLVPIFPEGGFNAKTLAVLKKNPVIFAAQYANDPSSSLTEFLPSWKRFYEKIDKYRIMVPTPVGNQILDIRELDICFLYDPAKKGNWGFCITAGDGVRVFVLEAIQDTMSPPVFVNFLFQKVIEYNPRVVSIESVLFQEIYKYWLETEMKTRKIYFPIYMYDVANQKKELRVKGLSNLLMNGMLYYHRSQKDLIEQHDGFGAIVEYHILDALAQGPKVWSTPFSKKKMEEYAEMEDAYLQGRNSITGY